MSLLKKTARKLLVSFFLSTIITTCNALSLHAAKLNRRNALAAGGSLLLSGAIPHSVSAKQQSIASRLDADILTMPPSSRANELNGIDNTYYPQWLAGTWDVTQTLVNTSAPLGLKFIGGPNGSLKIAQESFEEQRKQLNIPVHLQLRFVNTKFGVAEDRLFNTKQRLDNFAGRSVVSSVEYANVGGSNRSSVLALGGSADDPLQTTCK